MSKPRKNKRRSVVPEANPLILGLGLLAAVGALILLVVAFTAPRGLPGQPHYDLTLRTKDLASLGSRGADVRIAGKRVGQTLNGRIDHGVPTVDLQMSSDVGPLPADTKVIVRPRGLLGAEYVDVVPGKSSQKLDDGAVIGPNGTSQTAQVSDVLDNLDDNTRASLGQLVRGLGGGFAGRGTGLNQALGEAPQLLRNVHLALGPLLARNGATAGFIAGSDALARAFYPVREPAAEGFDVGSDALDPFNREAPSLKQTLDVAANALPSVRTSLARTDPALAAAERFSRSAVRFTDVAPAALSSLTKLAIEGRKPMGDARAVLIRAERAVGPTLKFTKALNPILPKLGQTLEQTRPVLQALAPYGCDFKGFVHNWRSFLSWGVPGQTGALGQLTSLRLEASSNVAPGVGLPPGIIPGTHITNASPAPCTKVGGP